MGTDTRIIEASLARPFVNPWPALVTGLAMTAAAFLWLQTLGFQALPMLLVGVLAAGAAVAIRPWSPLILGLTALSGFLACNGFHQDWDSARLMTGVLTGVAAAAAILMLVPRVVRRVAVSLLILLHFGGIISAVTSVPPTPWLSTMAWVHLYRPYLEFMYLNNAYHFYSPEPGTGALVWFYVMYEDGTAQWYKIPNRAENPLTLEYQRRLSIAESINQLVPPGPLSPDVEYKRRKAAEVDGIPFHPGLPPLLQYRPPTQYSKRMLETYARYAARNVLHPTGLRVTGVKIYRVSHNILLPKDVARGVNPDDLDQYQPYYQGEFSPEGVLKNPEDPYLYWLLPILKGPTSSAILKGPTSSAFHSGVGSAAQKLGEHEVEYQNYFEKHVQMIARGMDVQSRD